MKNIRSISFIGKGVFMARSIQHTHIFLCIGKESKKLWGRWLEGMMVVRLVFLWCAWKRLIGGVNKRCDWVYNSREGSESWHFRQDFSTSRARAFRAFSSEQGWLSICWIKGLHVWWIVNVNVLVLINLWLPSISIAWIKKHSNLQEHKPTLSSWMGWVGWRCWLHWYMYNCHRGRFDIFSQAWCIL